MLFYICPTDNFVCNNNRAKSQATSSIQNIRLNSFACIKTTIDLLRREICKSEYQLLKCSKYMMGHFYSAKSINFARLHFCTHD